MKAQSSKLNHQSIKMKDQAVNAERLKRKAHEIQDEACSGSSD